MRREFTPDPTKPLSVSSFVPAQPISGKEVAGVEHADPDLYSGKQIILTPLDRTHAPQVQQAIDPSDS